MWWRHSAVVQQRKEEGAMGEMGDVVQRSPGSVLLQKWRKGRGVSRSACVEGAGAGHSRGRSPSDDTDPDASGAGGAGLIHAAREQRRGRERERDETDMCAQEFKLNFGNLKSNQTCFDQKGLWHAQKFEIKYGSKGFEEGINFPYRSFLRFEMDFELKFGELSII
jgi:hypothetical protein